MKKILIPIDFSSISGHAADFALQISENKKIELIFFHLSDERVFTGKELKNLGKEKSKQDQKEMEKLILFVEKKVDKTKKIKLGRRFKFLLEHGDSAADSILLAAQKNKVDIVIMGTKGATGLKKIVFGSVASHLIREANVPVIVVPVKQPKNEKFDIVYATDFQNSNSELARLQPLRELLGGEIECLYINYGWAFTKKEQKEYDELKSSGLSLIEKKVTLKNPLGYHLQSYMKNRPGAVLCVFHENKSFFEKLIFRNRPESFVMEMKVPIASLQKMIKK